MAGRAGADEDRAGPADPSGPVVLLVDDEPEWIRWMSCYLRYSEWVIVTASSGAEGLAAYEGSLPDVVITDQKMAPMSGTELAAVLRDRGFAGPMLLLSGNIDPDTDSECARLGMHALSKLAHGAIFHTLDLFRQEVLTHRPLAVPLDTGGDVPSPGSGRSRRPLWSLSSRRIASPRVS